jgi:hypothetical protein
MDIETKVCESDQEAIEMGQKWSKAKLLIGIIKVIVNMSTISWAVYTYFAQNIINKIFIATNGELIAYLTSPVMIILVSGWVATSVIMGCNLQKAVATMIENAKLTAEFKAVTELKGNADLAQIIEAVKK